MSELVSIIVPVYNVEKYLDVCINSIVKQTYSDIEIIIVDDGSTDGSGTICDEWAAKDKRVHVIHKENGGLSDARNVGIDVSRGDWILFVDSDDFVHEKLVEICYTVAQEYKSDLVVFDLERVEENCMYQQVLESDNVIFEEYSGEEMLHEFVRNERMLMVACNKLYRRSVWDVLRFPVGKVHEDEFVIVDVWKSADRVVLTNCKLYYYRQREGSITSVRALKAAYDALEAFALRAEDLQGNNELFYLTLSRYLNQIIEVYQRETDIKKRRKLLGMFREKFSIRQYKYSCWRSFLAMLIFFLSPFFYYKIKGVAYRKQSDFE